MNEEKKEVFEVDIIELLLDLWKNRIIIIAFMVLAMAVMIIRVHYFTKDTYTANGVLYVSSVANIGDDRESITSNQIYTARTLSQTYMETLKLRSFLTDVSDAVNGKYSWERIKRMMDVTTLNDTEYINVHVTANSAQDAYDIANAICMNAHRKFSESFNGGSVTVVDNVIFPKAPNSKNEIKHTILAGLIGAAIGVGIIILKDLTDRKLHRVEEITKKYGIAILGATAPVTETSKNKTKLKPPKKGSEKYLEEISKIIDKDTDFDTIETYKSIRTNIMFSIPKQDDGKVILITSASPGEGKTTTSINLSITFAQMGAKIILLDCDLRKARVHRYLQIERDNGVSNVLCGYIGLDKAIKKNVRDNLDVITAGAIPPNPAELLGSEEFENMLSELKKQYDYIIIDTSPVSLVTDAVVIMKSCNGAVVVTRQEYTSHDLLSVALNELKKTNVKLLGTIVHECSEKRKKYGYYKSKKYGYKYGYKYSYGYGYRYGDQPTEKK